MKQKIPFTKDITFKTKIGEITSISLDNDLALKGEDLISGSFYLSGTYKMLESSTSAQEYSYKIPCDIAISSVYDTFDASIDIDDFYYEIIDDQILRINIVVAIEGLSLKEEEQQENNKEELKEEIIESKEEDKPIEKEVKEERTSNSFMEVKEKVKTENDTYLTYKVYIVTEDDTVDTIIEKYNITKEDLSDYNDLENIKTGTKLVIPSKNND